MNREDDLGVDLEPEAPGINDPDALSETSGVAPAPRKKKRLKQVFSAFFGLCAFIVLFSGVGFGGYVLFQLYSGLLGSGVEFETTAQVPEIVAGRTKPRTVSGDYTVLDLYFPDGGRLVHEERSVPRAATVREIASAVVTEFLVGPRATLLDSIPKGVTVNGVYYGNDMILYLDLTDAFRSNFQGGVVDEYLLLKALNQSLMANVYQVTGIRLLIEGSEVDSIGGHLSVRGFLADAVSAPLLDNYEE